MLTHRKQLVQVCHKSVQKVWNRATTKAKIGDIICAPFTPVMQVVDKYVYHVDGRVWLKVKPTNASCRTEEWLLDKEDSLQSQLSNEVEQGKQHGQSNIAERLVPIYKEWQYSSGYLEGYNSAQRPRQAKAIAKAYEWLVIYDGGWYSVWIDGVLVGKAKTSDKAEQIAQKQIAIEQFRKKSQQ